jgi:hypothetical protein
MPGLVPGIHVLLLPLLNRLKTWMAGTSPAMTEYVFVNTLLAIVAGSPFFKRKNARAEKIFADYQP